MSKNSKKFKKDEPRTKKLTRSIKHTFTQDERMALGDTMVIKLNEIEAKQDEAKQVAQQFKGQVAALEAELGAARNGFQAGFEMRSTEVIEVMDRPKQGQKQICVEDDEADDGRKVLFEEKMTFTDLNPPLPGIPEADKDEKVEPGQPLNPVAAAVEQAEEEAEEEEGEEI